MLSQFQEQITSHFSNLFTNIVLKNKAQLLFFIFLFILAYSKPVYADLGPIYITPLHSINQDGFGLNYDSNFQSSIVITEEFIANSGAANIADLLSKVVGLNVVNSLSASPSSIFLRGFDSHQVIVKLDGFEINDPSTPNNRAVLEYLNLNQIAQIKIIQGSGIISGSSSFSGVIEITTKFFESNDKNSKNLNLKIQTGSFNQNSINANVLLQKPNSSYFVAFGQSYANYNSAKIDNNESENIKNQFSEIAYKKVLSKNRFLNFNASHNFSDQDFDGCYDSSFALSNECKSVYEKNNFVIKFLSDSENKQTNIGISFQDLQRSLFTNNQKTGQYKANVLDLFWNSQLRIKKNINLTLGFDYKKDKVSEIFTPINLKTIRSNSLYSELEYSLGSQIFGIGLKKNKYQSPTHNSLSSDYSFSYLNQINSYFAIALSTAKSNRYPSIYQLFDSYAGNQSLKPEQVKQNEVGFLYKKPVANNQNDPLSLIGDIRIYKAKISDYLYFDNQYQNWNKGVKNEGFNVLFGAQNSSFNLSASYAQNSVYKENTNKRQLARRPEKIFQFNLSKKINRMQLNFIQKIQAQTYDLDTSDTVIAGYGVSDFSVSYLINQSKFKNAKLYFQINNLFDRNYQTIDGYRKAERNYLLTLDISL